VRVGVISSCALLLRNDSALPVLQAPRIINAMVDIAADEGLLQAALNTMEVSQVRRGSNTNRGAGSWTPVDMPSPGSIPCKDDPGSDWAVGLLTAYSSRRSRQLVILIISLVQQMVVQACTEKTSSLAQLPSLSEEAIRALKRQDISTLG
jgi:hypothetical protein